MSHRRFAIVAAVVFVVAFAIRLLPVLAHGGLRYLDRYDDGVYYAAADAFTFGRMPYRDFVLLHPPGLMLLLAPFAWLGRATSDVTGLEAGRIAMMAIGSVSAVGVAVIARRWGTGASLVAGLLYAVVWSAVSTERATLLEVPAGCCVVLAVAIGCRDQPIGRWRALGTGLLLGAAVSIKIWYAAPLVLVLGWLLLGPGLRRGRAAAATALGGAVAAAAVICGPFFVLAPRRMWAYVVTDQLRRTAERGQERARLPDFLGVATTRPELQILAPHTTRAVVHWHATEALIVLLAMAVAGCLLTRFGRFLAAWLLFSVAIVLVAPLYLSHYGALVAPAEVLVLVGGLGSLGGAVARDRGRRLTLALCGLLALVSAVRVCLASNSNPTFPTAAITAVAPPGCIASDSPAVLVLMDRLTPDLRSGCPLPVDVTGRIYTYHRQGLRRFRHYLRSYLFDSSAFAVWESTGIGSTVRPSIERQQLLYDNGYVALRAGRRFPGQASGS